MITHDELKNRPLVFGDKKQIEELKEANAKAIFCPRCNSPKTGEDCEWEGDSYFYCDDCKYEWEK